VNLFTYTMDHAAGTWCWPLTPFYCQGQK